MGIEMRVSVDKSDPGFPKYAELVSDGYIVVVKFNGMILSGVVTADEEAGEVIAHRFTNEGNIVCADGQFVYDKLRGDVKVEIYRPNDGRTLH